MTARRLLIFLIGGLVLLFCAGFVAGVVAAGGLGLLDSDDLSPTQAYIIEFLLIYGDAIIPLLPGETTLNTAATMAANGELELSLVILAGALGAVLGDSSLYWIARLAGEKYQPQVDKARQDSRVKLALDILGDRQAMLIVFGRYVPGLRFVVNATMGVTKMPYPRFLFWSTIGGTTWAIYTAGLAYWVGSSLGDYPLASIIVSGAITTILIAVVFFLERGRIKKDRAEALAD